MVRVYGWYAPVYNLVFGRILHAGRTELAGLVASRTPERILEVGVGTGLALPLYPAESQVCGVDISLEMLKRAQSLVREQNLSNVHLTYADAEQMPFRDASFDCVVLPYVLSVTPDPQRLLSETRRVCVPNGRILVLNHFSGARYWKFAERVTAPMADWVGFHSTMSIDILESPCWQINDVRSVNLFGLSKLVDIRNSRS